PCRSRGRAPLPKVRHVDSRRHRAWWLRSLSQVRVVARAAAAVALALIAVRTTASAQRRGQPAVTGGRIAAEVAAGTAAMPIGFIGGGIATRWVARKFGASDDAASSAGLVGAYTIATFVTAVPPTLIGQAGHHATGSYLAALAGTAIGGLGSFALIRLN